MFKMFLRVMAEIVIFTLLIPFKLIYLVYYVIKAIVSRDCLTVRERLYYFGLGYKAQLKAELHWIKTGEITSFYEHIDPEEIELY